MSVDLSQFFDVFFDEAEEHLANLESQVLGLDLTAVDTDTQNEIFRAAHSIKVAPPPLVSRIWRT